MKGDWVLNNIEHMEINDHLRELHSLTDKLNFIKENNINPSYELLSNFEDDRSLQWHVFFEMGYYKLLKEIILLTKPKTLLDPFCGLGMLLINLSKEINSHSLNINEIVGKVLNFQSFFIIS